MSKKHNVTEILKELKSIEKPIFTMNLDSIGNNEFGYCLFSNKGIVINSYWGCLYGPFTMTQLEYDTVKRFMELGVEDEDLYHLCEEGIISEQEMDDLNEKHRSLDLDDKYSTLKLLISLNCQPNKEYFLVAALEPFPGDEKFTVYCSRQEIKDEFYGAATSCLSGIDILEKWDDMDENDIILWHKYLKENPEENWDIWENHDINDFDLD